MRIRKQFRFLPSSIDTLDWLKEKLPNNPDIKKTDTYVVEEGLRVLREKIERETKTKKL